MTHRAIIETDGTGHVLGVWTLTEADGSPDVAFADELAQLDAEALLGDAATVLDGAGGYTWDDFLQHLSDRQNHITRERYLGETELGAPELLAAAQAAEKAREPLSSLLS